MTINQSNSAALQFQAALSRLEIQHGHTTEAELAADDAAILPALVDGEPVITPAQKFGVDDRPENSNQITSPA